MCEARCRLLRSIALVLSMAAFPLTAAASRTVAVFPTIVRAPDGVSFDAGSRDGIARILKDRFTVVKPDSSLTFDVAPGVASEQHLARGVEQLGAAIRGLSVESDFAVVAEYVIRDTNGGEAIGAIHIYILGSDGRNHGSRAIDFQASSLRDAKLESESARQRERMLRRADLIAASAAGNLLADDIVRGKAEGAPAAATREWEKTWAAAFEKARSERKLVFVDFFAAWCAPCRRMDAQTFRDPGVRDRLSRFVFLKLQYDEVKEEKLFRVPALPWYSIRDPWGRQHVAYMSYFDAPVFARHLDQVLAAAPDLIEIGEALHTKETAATYMRLGAVFDRMKSVPDARNAYARAAALAEGENDRPLAQRARIEAAVIRIRQGEIGEAIDDLRPLAATPANAECEAAIWLAIGFGEQKRARPADARKAYERALAAAPAESALVPQIERQLAALRP